MRDFEALDVLYLLTLRYRSPFRGTFEPHPQATDPSEIHCVHRIHLGVRSNPLAPPFFTRSHLTSLQDRGNVHRLRT